MTGYVNDFSIKKTSSPKNKAWMRRIRVTLYSSLAKSFMTFGDNVGDNFNIDISGTKRLSLTQDKGVIAINNIEYDTILKIMALEYYKIQVEVGYENGPFETYFNGYVSYITQKVHSRHDYTLYIAYASELVAAFSRNRINFTLNSSINTYAAMNYITKLSGMENCNLSNSLKTYILGNVVNSANGNITSTTSLLLNNTSTDWITSSDSSLGQIISITDLSNKRVIKIDNDSIIMTGGNPTVTSDGLKMTLIPTMNLMPGDILHIDNGLLDISTNNMDVTNEFTANYIDKNGNYVIQQIDYHFQNRGSSFELNIQGRAVSLFQGLTE